MPTQTPASRVSELDGIRGVAILLVVLWHYVACQINATPGSQWGPLEHLLGLCWSGVDLFFVLSGYLICGILLDHRDSPKYFQAFYLRRTCRILPLYFLVVLSFVFVHRFGKAAPAAFQWLLQGNIPLWSYFTFTQNFQMGSLENFGSHWLAATWSLAIEEQFYLLFPFIVRWLPHRALVTLLLCGSSIALGLRLAFPGFPAFVLLPFRMDALFMGCLVAVFMRTPPALGWIRKHPAFLQYVLGPLLLILLYMVWKGTWPGRWNLTVLSLFYAILLLFILLNPASIPARMARHRMLRFLGTLSFGLYLFHQPISGLLHGFLRDSEPRLGSWADLGVTLLSLAGSVTLAWLTERFLERKITGWGHQFGYGPNSSIFTPKTAT